MLLVEIYDTYISFYFEAATTVIRHMERKILMVMDVRGIITTLLSVERETLMILLPENTAAHVEAGLMVTIG